MNPQQITCTCSDFQKSQWCEHMPPGAVQTGWNPQLQEIKVGDSIWVDKGRLGLDSGEVKSIDEYTVGGFNGVYFSDTEGRDKRFDQTVHNISLKEVDVVVTTKDYLATELERQRREYVEAVEKYFLSREIGKKQLDVRDDVLAILEKASE